MITKTKILIGILVVVILAAGGWWVWNKQNVGIICGVSDSLYCESDSDCICADAESEYPGCFLGSKNYYEKCINKTDICMDFCTGWGQPPVKCINNQCTISYKIEEVTIATDKTEYEQEEVVQINVSIAEIEYIPLRIYYLPLITFVSDLQEYKNGEWVKITFNSKDYAKCTDIDIEPPACKDLSTGGNHIRRRGIKISFSAKMGTLNTKKLLWESIDSLFTTGLMNVMEARQELSTPTNSQLNKIFAW